MIDWDEVNGAESVDELKNVKLWLFQENTGAGYDRSGSGKYTAGK